MRFLFLLLSRQETFYEWYNSAAVCKSTSRFYPLAKCNVFPGQRTRTRRTCGRILRRYYDNRKNFVDGNRINGDYVSKINRKLQMPLKKRKKDRFFKNIFIRQQWVISFANVIRKFFVKNFEIIHCVDLPTVSKSIQIWNLNKNK